MPAVASCSPDERQGSFLKEWLDSHLAAAETINKPLLFEEFGKKLSPGADPDTITKLRDPVYEASYQAVEAAVESDRPLLGSLYWKWAVPGLEKGEWAAGGEIQVVCRNMGYEQPARLCGCVVYVIGSAGRHVGKHGFERTSWAG
jgi:hypothetical protein